MMKFIPCHRMKSRSYVIRGKQFPICARCTSILLGYLATPFLLCLDYQPTSLTLFCGIYFNIPMIVDGYTQLRGWRKSTNTLRTITGLGSGIGQSFIIIWLVETLFNLIVKLS